MWNCETGGRKMHLISSHLFICPSPIGQKCLPILVSCQQMSLCLNFKNLSLYSIPHLNKIVHADTNTVTVPNSCMHKKGYIYLMRIWAILFCQYSTEWKICYSSNIQLFTKYANPFVHTNVGTVNSADDCMHNGVKLKQLLVRVPTILCHFLIPTCKYMSYTKITISIYVRI